MVRDLSVSVFARFGGHGVRQGHAHPPGLGDPQGVGQALGQAEAGETDLRVRRGRVVQHLAGEAEHVGAGGELDGLKVVGGRRAEGDVGL
ncbi:hypothetical protein [Streptomyces sp. NPDC088801]|uniref:hypothetical protein n=1 Tax=Streptomyces sp. NPDC088801 TaxID=3365903 RepID=UPI0038115EEF